jgi:hypothetical protein
MWESVHTDDLDIVCLWMRFEFEVIKTKAGYTSGEEGRIW